jgi:hypothetical protein
MLVFEETCNPKLFGLGRKNDQPAALSNGGFDRITICRLPN